MDNNDKNIFDDDFDFFPSDASAQNNNENQLVFNEDIVYKSDNKNNKENNKYFNRSIKILPIIAFVFVLVLGIYIFINNVNADKVNLIKIEEKSKVGYINKLGNVVVRPKFLYGTDFYSGYAIVKNYNNLYGIIDSSGSNAIAFGNIFSASIYDDRYIVTKFTNDGLKMGLLNANLKDVTRFIYDNLSYIDDGLFMYTKDDVMGIMNKDGKEIYSYKVDEVDDRNISVEVSNITNNESKNKYAKVKINSSSTIINIQTGKEVYKYTLDDIRVLDNNVFYIKKNSENNLYFIIKDDKVVFESRDYKRVKIDDINSDIAIAIKEDASLEYIDLLTRKVINFNDSKKYTYSDGIVLEEDYDFTDKKTKYTVITPKEILGSFTDIKPYNDIYVNGYMKIIVSDGKYNYVDKKGKIISNNEYENASDFDKYGFAIVSKDNKKGIINKNGNEIIPLKYADITFLDDKLFDSIYKKTKEELFIFMENGKYGIISSKNKVVVKAVYDSFDMITIKYPIIKAKYDGNNTLINLETFREISINCDNDINIYDEYIISNGDYYNYDGKLIYNAGGNL